ncbi:GHKL domain-containing protein [Listeria sp. SHR_NRA_18]|nr:GHKL domain-containing protein [Listeria sp. SHR_NRA_18]
MLLFFANIIQVTCLLIGIQVLSRVRFSWKLFIVLIVGISLTAFPIFLTLTYLSVVYMMLVFAAILYWKTKSIRVSLIATTSSFVIVVIANILAGLTLGTVSQSQPFITSVLIFVYACLIFKVVDIIMGRLSKEIIFQNKYLALVLAVSSATVGLFYFYIVQGSKLEFTEAALEANAFIFLMYTAIMIVVLTIIVRSAVKNAKVEAQALQMSQLREYVGALEALQKDMRVFRHDYVNILSGINGFITNSDMDGLSVYFRTKVIPMNSDMEVNISKLSTLQNLEVIELKGLFATKMIRAQELGVDAQVEVYKRIDEMNMDSIDLCRVTGILLDNAIEAVVDTADPTVRVAIIQKKEAIVLIFANSLPEDSPPIHQFFEEGFSTKGENRGIGLSTLKKTLKKYPNVSLDTKITQHGFVQELEIG